MVKHVILWQLKDEFSEDEKKKIKEDMVVALKGLVGKVPGVLDVNLKVEGLESSNAEILLDTTLTDEEALKGYAVHPDHVEVADVYVRPFTKNRLCMDYEI